MSISELSSMLGYPQILVMPQTPATVTHRIGFSGSDRYVASIKAARQMREKAKPEGLTVSQKVVLKMLQSRKTPFSSREMSGKTGLSKNFCNTTMALFYKQGLVTRVKERVALTKQYVYAIRP